VCIRVCVRESVRVYERVSVQDCPYRAPCNFMCMCMCVCMKERERARVSVCESVVFCSRIDYEKSVHHEKYVIRVRETHTCLY